VSGVPLGPVGAGGYTARGKEVTGCGVEVVDGAGGRSSWHVPIVGHCTVCAEPAADQDHSVPGVVGALYGLVPRGSKNRTKGDFRERGGRPVAISEGRLFEYVF
jgi:hypothetical protein